MKTSVAATSLDAYHSLPVPALQRKEREVMDLFAAHPGLAVTRERLAELLGWKECSACGRANSLVAKSLLEEVEGGKTRSGRGAMLLRVPVKAQFSLPLESAQKIPH